ncbi:hypothetical protein P152DRAFT_497435 [Eremomyces bilateralis CBS 781.70]|uniref:Uncharacterized protein n=1 Tax=Eremomyces bilateralis CBS 781.70 TaxID=1392243 RepID=A0A6G1FSI0_9PEZI|nr:uncharacterized protein P152DRAFT_497435 [Eremomyces bilateralis CBS 781.70]KAF1808632.1 hypothetical protein P152DRAFT_497435 [Eremomyces bilateralis CBS 781.70]
MPPPQYNGGTHDTCSIFRAAKVVEDDLSLTDKGYGSKNAFAVFDRVIPTLRHLFPHSDSIMESDFVSYVRHRREFAKFITEQAWGAAQNESDLRFSTQGPRPSDEPLAPRLHIAFHGRQFRTNRSAVLAQETIWCENWGEVDYIPDTVREFLERCGVDTTTMRPKKEAEIRNSQRLPDPVYDDSDYYWARHRPSANAEYGEGGRPRRDHWPYTKYTVIRDSEQMRKSEELFAARKRKVFLRYEPKHSRNSNAPNFIPEDHRNNGPLKTQSEDRTSAIMTDGSLAREEGVLEQNAAQVDTAISEGETRVDSTSNIESSKELILESRNLIAPWPHPDTTYDTPAKYIRGVKVAPWPDREEFVFYGDDNIFLKIRRAFPLPRILSRRMRRFGCSWDVRDRLPLLEFDDMERTPEDEFRDPKLSAEELRDEESEAVLRFIGL